MQRSSDSPQPVVRLSEARVATRLPSRDLDRARRFYAEKLGLEPSEERLGGLLYRCGGTEFALFLSAGSSPGTFTQMGWQVDDIEATVAELRARGLQPDRARAGDLGGPGKPKPRSLQRRAPDRVQF